MAKKLIVACIIGIMIFQSSVSIAAAVIDAATTETVSVEEIYAGGEEQEIQPEPPTIEIPQEPEPEEIEIPEMETPNVQVPNAPEEENVDTPDLEGMRFGPAQYSAISPFNAGASFTRQGQTAGITSVTLFTNGTPAERTVNVDSVLRGIAINPGATWQIQNTNVATLSGSGGHPIWQDYAANRFMWVLANPGYPLRVRSTPYGPDHSTVIGNNSNGTRVTAQRRRLRNSLDTNYFASEEMDFHMQNIYRCSKVEQDIIQM